MSSRPAATIDPGLRGAIVPNLTIRNMPEKEYAALRKDAERSGRSLNAEILALIYERTRG
jgi:hypothetical protein